MGNNARNWDKARYDKMAKEPINGGYPGQHLSPPSKPSAPKMSHEALEDMVKAFLASGGHIKVKAPAKADHRKTRNGKDKAAIAKKALKAANEAKRRKNAKKKPHNPAKAMWPNAYTGKATRREKSGAGEFKRMLDWGPNPTKDDAPW